MVIIEKIEVLKIEMGKHWVVEVTDNKPQGTKEFWLYHKQFGIKGMMFGIMAKETELINNLIEDMWETSKVYRKQYLDNYVDNNDLCW